MKKLMMMVIGMCALVAIAQESASTQESASQHPVDDECVWSWWSGAPRSNLEKDLRGCSIGIGSGFRSVRGAQISLCMNTVEHMTAGAQVAFGYNRATRLNNGCQVACVNVSDSAALQFGLLCFNKNGFLPFFVLFNFDKRAFGNAD